MADRLQTRPSQSKSAGRQENDLSSAIEAIYAAALSPSLWPQALEAIAHAFEDVGAILIYTRSDGSSGLISSPGIAEAAAAYNREWWQQDFRLIRSRERGFLVKGDTITDRHVVTDEESSSHPFYTEFLASFGVKWFAGTSISPDNGVWVGLSLQRAIAKSPYSDEELERFTLIGRHVESALRVSLRLINAEVVSAALSDALTRFGVGVFMVDAAGRVAFSNPAARSLLGDCLLLANGMLKASIASEQPALQAAIAEVLEHEPGTAFRKPSPILLREPSRDKYLAVYVLPVELPSGSIDRLLANVRALVLVVPSAVDQPPDPTVVRDLLNVTTGEARVAALVGSGLPPREAAQRLGITEETARTTLKRVFAKVGVSRQSELAALLARLTLG